MRKAWETVINSARNAFSAYSNAQSWSNRKLSGRRALTFALLHTSGLDTDHPNENEQQKVLDVVWNETQLAVLQYNLTQSNRPLSAKLERRVAQATGNDTLEFLSIMSVLEAL